MGVGPLSEKNRQKALSSESTKAMMEDSWETEDVLTAENLSSHVKKAWSDFGGALYSFALTLMGSKADGEDILQSVFLALVRSVERGSRVKNLKAYLYRSVRNEALRLKRHRARQVSVEIEDSPLLVESKHHRLEEALDLSKALASLPVDQREVVVLRSIME